MSLVVRALPVFHRSDSFFENLFGGMTMDMADMTHEMEMMRRNMFHLLPVDDKDITKTEMNVSRPIIESKGQSKMHLKFDVSGFKPEEVNVKVVGDHMLKVHAEHHEKSGSGERSCVYMRQYSLPKGVDANQVVSEMTKDGVLTIEAPAPPLSPAERLVPIKYKE